MSDYNDAMHIAASAMRAQSLRVRIAAENIANADSYDYKRKTLSFEAALPEDGGNGGVKIGDIERDTQTPTTQKYQPWHPMADENGYVASSNVNSLVEAMDAKQAQHHYEAALNMFDQARSLQSRIIDLLRG